MATVHMSEAEVALDLHAVLAKVQQGVEMVIEQDYRPVAVLKSSLPVGRMISEIVADLKARGSSAVMDDEFARGIEEGIKARRQPWNPPAWDYRRPELSKTYIRPSAKCWSSCPLSRSQRLATASIEPTRRKSASVAGCSWTI